MKKSVKIGLAVVVALPLITATAIPLFVDANTFRPAIESRLSAALSRKVTLGALSLSVMTGSLVADDLAIAEDPKFGQTPFFTAKRLRIGVQMKPLIFNRQLIVQSFEVEAPQIHLIQAEDGTWNFSTLSHGATLSPGAGPGDAAASPNAPQSASLAELPVTIVTINDGNAKIDKIDKTETTEELPSEKNTRI